MRKKMRFKKAKPEREVTFVFKVYGKLAGDRQETHIANFFDEDIVDEVERYLLAGVRDIRFDVMPVGDNGRPLRFKLYWIEGKGWQEYYLVKDVKAIKQQLDSMPPEQRTAFIESENRRAAAWASNPLCRGRVIRR